MKRMEASRKRIVAYQAAAQYYEGEGQEKRINAREFMITFPIEEGPEVFTRTIEIIGNRRLKTQAILATMETRVLQKTAF